MGPPGAYTGSFARAWQHGDMPYGGGAEHLAVMSAVYDEGGRSRWPLEVNGLGRVKRGRSPDDAAAQTHGGTGLGERGASQMGMLSLGMLRDVDGCGVVSSSAESLEASRLEQVAAAALLQL